MKARYASLALVSIALLMAASMSEVSAFMKESKSGDICGVSQDELFQCKPACTAGAASPPLPNDECCAALRKANLPCFCSFKNNKYLPLLGINGTRAMELPGLCDPPLAVPRC